MWKGSRLRSKTPQRSAPQDIIGRRRGRRREKWIKDRSWKLIDERKIAKLKRDQAMDADDREAGNQRYAELDRLVKKSCQMDKKEWFPLKGDEAQETADRNDT